MIFVCLSVCLSPLPPLSRVPYVFPSLPVSGCFSLSLSLSLSCCLCLPSYTRICTYEKWTYIDICVCVRFGDAEIEEFQEIVRGAVAVIEGQVQLIEREKLSAIGLRNQVEGEIEIRKRKQEELQSVVDERLVELERSVVGVGVGTWSTCKHTAAVSSVFNHSDVSDVSRQCCLCFLSVCLSICVCTPVSGYVIP